jgi:hypothetical protein
MTDYKALMRALTANARYKERERHRKALALIKRAQKAGLPLRSAVVEDVRLEFGTPEAASVVNEWDQDLGTHPAKIRQ